MTLEQLRILEAIAEAGSLGGASKLLHRTQPTLSVAIKNLEEELGVSIFDRSSYRMELTDHGKEILVHSKSVLMEANQLLSRAKEMTGGRESQISIGIDYLCPLSVLLNMLKEFSANCEGTHLDLKFGVLSETENWLKNEEASIGLTPFIHSPADFEMKQITDLKVLPVVSKSLTSKGKITDQQFQKIPQIIAKTQDRNELGPFSVSLEENRWRVSDHMIKKQLIVNGFGWGHLEESSIADELAVKKVVEIKNKFVRRKSVPLFLVRKSTAAKGPVATELWDFLSASFN